MKNKKYYCNIIVNNPTKILEIYEDLDNECKIWIGIESAIIISFEIQIFTHLKWKFNDACFDQHCFRSL